MINKQVRYGLYMARDGVYRVFLFYFHMELLCYCVVLCHYYCFANHTKPDLSEGLTFFSKVISLYIF